MDQSPDGSGDNSLETSVDPKPNLSKVPAVQSAEEAICQAVVFFDDPAEVEADQSAILHHGSAVDVAVIDVGRSAEKNCGNRVMVGAGVLEARR
jgi:hypothetical protein